MSNSIASELVQKRCKPCEGGVPPVGREEAERLLAGLSGWELASDAKSIRRQWRANDFMTAIDFFNRVAHLAEEDDHHPDLHLTGYRDVRIELSTHAIGGLSENDFILAAKINELPIELKK